MDIASDLRLNLKVDIERDLCIGHKRQRPVIGSAKAGLEVGGGGTSRPRVHYVEGLPGTH